MTSAFRVKKKPRGLSDPGALAAWPSLHPRPSHRSNNHDDTGACGTRSPSEAPAKPSLAACRHAAPPGPPGPVHSTRQYSIGRRGVKSLFAPPAAGCSDGSGGSVALELWVPCFRAVAKACSSVRRKHAPPGHATPPRRRKITPRVIFQTGGRPDASSGTVAGGAMTVIRRQRPERNRPHIASPSTITYADADDHGPKMPHSGLR